MSEINVLITISPEILGNSQPDEELTYQRAAHTQICSTLEICRFFAHTTFLVIVLWEPVAQMLCCEKKQGISNMLIIAVEHFTLLVFKQFFQNCSYSVFSLDFPMEH